MAFNSIGAIRDSWTQTGNYYLNWNWNWTANGTAIVTSANWVTNWTSASTNNYVYLPAGTTYTPITMTARVVPGGAFNPSMIHVKSAAEVALEQAAETASEELVRSLVGEAGYKMWKALGYIEIESKRLPGTVYRIKGNAIDLFQKKDGAIIDLRQWLCVHPKPLDKGIYPVGDEVATRVLLARFAEDELWEKANLHDKGRTATMSRQEQLARYQRLAQIAA